MGRETNSAQSCDDRMVTITDAALPRCTSIAIFWLKIEEPYCFQSAPWLGSLFAAQWTCTGSTNTKGLITEREKWKVLNLADSVAFASLLVPLEEVDTLEGARVLEQVKSQSSSKPCLQGIKNMPSGLLPSLWHTPTGSKTAGTIPISQYASYSAMFYPLHSNKSKEHH